MKYICKLCYREFDEKEMVITAGGYISDYCQVCSSLLGKGAGYKSEMSQEEAEKWLEGFQERKKEYENKGQK